MIHNKTKELPTNLKNLSTEELRMLLFKLEDQHDILQAKNQQLTIQISDLRNAVKCVESQRKQNVSFELQKKKSLQQKIESLQKGMKYATKNSTYQAALGYKILMQ